MTNNYMVAEACAYLDITIKLNSSRFKIESKDEKILVFVTEKPKDNKVNIEIIKNFEKKLCAKTRIVKGAKIKKKTIKIDGMAEETVKQMLNI